MSKCDMPVTYTTKGTSKCKKF